MATSWMRNFFLVAALTLTACSGTGPTTSDGGPASSGSAGSGSSSGGGGSGGGSSSGGGASSGLPTGNAAVALSWSSASTPEINGYRVYVGTSSGRYAKSYLVADGTRTNYIVGQLGDGTLYFAVAALSELGGESELSNELSLTISN